MKMRLALLSVLALGAPAAVSADPWVITPGDYYSEFRGQYFSSNTYHDGTGERPPLPNGATYEDRALSNFTEVGWKKWGSFHFAIPVESVTRTLDNGSSSTQSGISDIMMGVKVKLMGGGKSALAMDVDFQAPAGYNRHLDPALGDGVQDFIGRLEYGASLGFGFVTASGAYRLRMGALANVPPPQSNKPDDDLLFTADLGAWVGESFLVSGAFRSQRVMVQEQEPAEGDVFSHLVGLQALYRVNDRLDVFTGTLSTMSAENALHVNQFYAGISVKDTHLNRNQGFLGNTRKP